MVAADKLGMTPVTLQCSAIIDRCPLDRVLQIISDASDIGLSDLSILDSKVGRSLSHCAYITRRAEFKGGGRGGLRDQTPRNVHLKNFQRYVSIVPLYLLPH